MCKFGDNGDFNGYYDDGDILVFPKFDETIGYPTGHPLDFSHMQEFICYAVVYKGETHIVEPEVICHDFGYTKTLIYHELDTRATAKKIGNFIETLMLEDR